MKSARHTLAILDTLSSPACGLAHERLITNKEGILVDAPVCPAHIRRTRISCAHCLDKNTQTDARKTFLNALEFLRNKKALSEQEYTQMTAIVHDAGRELDRADVDKNNAIRNMEEVRLDWEMGNDVIAAVQKEIDELSDCQRDVAAQLQELLELARERCIALIEKR